MFTCTAMLPERSGPLTPRVNCFHSVSETEWCGDVFFLFFSPRFIFKNATTATPCLYTCSHETLNTRIHRHAAVREGETVATFKFPTTDIWARHDKTLFSSAEPVCYLAAGVPWDFYRVHFLCLQRQHRGSFIFEGGETSIQHRGLLACCLTPVLGKYLENPKLVLRASCLWSGENYPPILKIKMSQL